MGRITSGEGITFDDVLFRVPAVFRGNTESG